MKIVPESINEAMGFQRGIDPKEAIGIGRLANISSESIKNAFACVRNYSLDDLENIYRRIRAKSNISLDGISIDKLSNHEWVDFNNKIVNGIKSFNRRQAKEKSSFKEGDILKAVYNGRTYFGVYDGIDKHGRIKARGYNVKLAFNLDQYVKATPEEEEVYRKKGIEIEKQRMKRQIERVESLIAAGLDKRSDLDYLLKKYENRFGEKYES